MRFMSDEGGHPDRDQLRLLLEQVDARLEIQVRSLESLDEKATTILGATGVVLGLVLASGDDFSSANQPVPAFYYGALVALAIGLVIGVKTLWPQGLSVVPEPKVLVNDYYGRSLEQTIADLLPTKRDAFAENVELSEAKGRGLRVQMVIVAVGGILLVAAYVLVKVV
jgi:hypothetical protein